MTLQRVQLLDDHIVVLHDMINLLKEELRAATEEREDLLKELGIARLTQTGEQTSCSDCLNSPKTSTSTGLEKEGQGKRGARSFSPTSPLECLRIEEVRNFGRADSLSIENLTRTRSQDDGNTAVVYTEPLPTPRRSSRRIQPSEEVFPDMNNALSDSDDESSSDDEQYVQILHGERPTTYINNAGSEEHLDTKSASEPCWIANTAFASCVLHMIRANRYGVEDECESIGTKRKNNKESESLGCSHRVSESFGMRQSSATGISLRSCESELFKRASIAHRSTLELKQMRLELQDKEMQIAFLSEKLISCKNALKRETSDRHRDVKALREELNEASTSKFLLFCKLQSAEARLKEMEEKKQVQMSPFLDVDDIKIMGSTVQKENERSKIQEVDTIDLSLDTSRPDSRPNTPLSLSSFPHKGSQLVGHHPLQETLSDTYKQLLLAEKREDTLLKRIRELEGSSCRGQRNQDKVQPNKSNARTKRIGSNTTKKRNQANVMPTRATHSDPTRSVRNESRLTQDRVSNRIRPTVKQTRRPQTTKPLR